MQQNVQLYKLKVFSGYTYPLNHDTTQRNAHFILSNHFRTSQDDQKFKRPTTKVSPENCIHVYKLFDESIKNYSVSHIRNICRTRVLIQFMDLIAYGDSKHVQYNLLECIRQQSFCFRRIGMVAYEFPKIGLKQQ